VPASNARPTGEITSPIVLWTWRWYVLVILALVVALSPMTHQLDDIKEWIMHVGGASMLVLYAFLRMRGDIPAAPRAIRYGYGAFMVVNVLSTLVRALPFLTGASWDSPESEDLLYRHAITVTGIEVTWFYAAVGGFFLLGASLVTTRDMIERSMRLWLLTAFLTTFFGLFHYGGGMKAFYSVFFEDAEDTSRFSSLIFTFAQNREMLSTVLNTQFFGNFLVMVMPVSASALFFAAGTLSQRQKNGEGTISPMFWIGAGAAGALMSMMCIYLTFQKSSLYLLPVIIVLYLLGLQFLTRYRLQKIPGLGLIGGGFLATAAIVFGLSRVDFDAKMISFDDSVGPRKIIFGGAWNQFLEYPILGAGPGSYRVLFTSFRDPEYHLNRIANVTQFSHNWILDLLSEVGIFGFATYAVAIGSVFVLGWRVLRTSDDHVLRVAALGYMVGLLSILAGNLATPMSRWPIGAGSLHAFAGLGAGVIAYALARGNIARDPLTGWRGRVAIGTACVFLLATISRQNDVWNASIQHSRGLEALNNVDEYSIGMTAAEIGRNRVLRDEFLKAGGFFRASLDLDPTRPTTYYKLGYVYNRTNDVQRALKAYRDLQKYSPDYSEIHYNLGVLYQAMAMSAARSEDKKDHNNAITYMEQAVHEFRRAAELSKRLYVHKQYASTLILCANMLGDEDGKPFARLAGDVLSAMAEFRLPADKTERAREEAARLEALRNAPEAYMLSEDYDLALEAYEQLLAEQPSDTGGFVGAYYAARFSDQPERAKQLVERALALNPLNGKFHLLELDRRFQDAPDDAPEYARFMLQVDETITGFLTDEERQAIAAEMRGVLVDRETTGTVTKQTPKTK